MLRKPRWMSRNTVAVAGLVTVASLMTSVIVAVGALSVSNGGHGGSPEPMLAGDAPAPTAVTPITPSPSEVAPTPTPPPAPPEESTPSTSPSTQPPTEDSHDTPTGPTSPPTSAPPTESGPGLPWTQPPWVHDPLYPTDPQDPGDPSPTDTSGWVRPEYVAWWLWCWAQPWPTPECAWMGR